MERLSLEDLQIALIDVFGADYKKRALIGPMIYDFDDRYYAAAMNFIHSGRETELQESYLTTKMIEDEFKCHYLVSLCILNHVKNHPAQINFIMHFEEVE